MILFLKVFCLLVTLSLGAWLAVRFTTELGAATKAMREGQPPRFPLPNLGLWAVWLAAVVLLVFLHWGY